jgi:hypothetical protein
MYWFTYFESVGILFDQFLQKGWKISAVGNFDLTPALIKGWLGIEKNQSMCSHSHACTCERGAANLVRT